MSDILSQEEVDGLLRAVHYPTGDDVIKREYRIELRGGGFEFHGRGDINVIVAAFKAFVQAVGR